MSEGGVDVFCGLLNWVHCIRWDHDSALAYVNSYQAIFSNHCRLPAAASLQVMFVVDAEELKNPHCGSSGWVLVLLYYTLCVSSSLIGCDSYLFSSLRFSALDGRFMTPFYTTSFFKSS